MGQFFSMPLCAVCDRGAGKRESPVSRGDGALLPAPLPLVGRQAGEAAAGRICEAAYDSLHTGECREAPALGRRFTRHVRRASPRFRFRAAPSQTISRGSMRSATIFPSGSFS